MDVRGAQLEVFSHDHVLAHRPQLLVAEIGDGDVHIRRLLPTEF